MHNRDWPKKNWSTFPRIWHCPDNHQLSEKFRVWPQWKCKGTRNLNLNVNKSLWSLRAQTIFQPGMKKKVSSQVLLLIFPVNMHLVLPVQYTMQSALGLRDTQGEIFLMTDSDRRKFWPVSLCHQSNSSTRLLSCIMCYFSVTLSLTLFARIVKFLLKRPQHIKIAGYPLLIPNFTDSRGNWMKFQTIIWHEMCLQKNDIFAR